jgi:hypothetical protein
MDRNWLPRRLGLAAMAAFGASLGVADAADRTENFKAKAVTLKDFTGTVEIKVGGPAVDVKLTDGARPHRVDFSVQNDRLMIVGEERPRNYRLHREIDHDRHGEDAFRIYLEDYPHLLITAPKGTDIAFDDAVVIALVDSLESDAVVGGGYVEAVFGDMKSADISLGGAGDISMGTIAGPLDLAIGGSGDFDAVSAASAEIRIGGSGDVRVGPVAGDAGIVIGGSGNVDLASVGGALAAAVRGSGDIFAGKVGKGADLSIAGSGDISVDRIDGPASVTIAGAGDIGVRDGRAENLKVTIAGSGDFVFGGVSTNLEASIVGSGAISIGANEGALSYAGAGGGLTVGGERVKRRK